MTQKNGRGQKISWKSSLMLFAAAFIWGTAFVAQSVGMDYLGPLSFNGARFFMGGAALLPVAGIARARRRKAETGKDGGHSVRRQDDEQRQNSAQRCGGMQQNDERRQDGKATLQGGVCCGTVLCAASLLQQYGIMRTSVGKAGFITALYIILVPFFGVFLKKKIPGKVWAGAAIAALGMYLLCMSESLALGIGDGLVFLCAVLFSVHILVIDYFSPKADGVELSCVQFLTAGILASVLALLFEEPCVQDFIAGIVPLAYAGILSCGVAYTFQVVGQKGTDPTVAALILSLESAVSVLAGWVILGQALTGRELAGCGLMFGAVILVQLPGFSPKEKTLKKI